MGWEEMVWAPGNAQLELMSSVFRSGVGDLGSWGPFVLVFLCSAATPPFRCKWQSLWPVKWHTGKSLMMNCWQN
jgi:hypothetical protein